MLRTPGKVFSGWGSVPAGFDRGWEEALGYYYIVVTGRNLELIIPWEVGI